MTDTEDLIATLTAHLEVAGQDIAWMRDNESFALVWDVATGPDAQSIEATIWDDWGTGAIARVRVTFEAIPS